MKDYNFDVQTAEYFLEIVKAREALKGPRIGDFVMIPSTGRYMRCAYDWGEKMQLSHGGSFSIGSSGRASISGSLEPGVDKKKLKQLDKFMSGSFWIWHRGQCGAGRGIDVLMGCRVYILKE